MTAFIALATRYWYAFVIAALVALLGVQQVQIANLGAAHSKTKAENADVLRTLAEKTKASYEAVMRSQEAKQGANEELDQKHAKELRDALTENKRLADCVRTGTCGLRVRATCPTSTGADVPQTPGSTSVADAPGPRLDEVAERDYFDLRAGIETTRSQIAGLQEYARRVCQ